MFYEKLGFSKEKTIFATLHEIEHFLEKIQMLSEKDGEKNFEKYLKRIETSKAFGLMDNCVADIRENKTVVSKTNRGMKELEEKITDDENAREIQNLAEELEAQGRVAANEARA